MAGPKAKGRGQRKKRPSQKVKENVEAESTVNPSMLSQPAVLDIASNTPTSASAGHSAAGMLSPDRPRKRAAPLPEAESPPGTSYPTSQPEESVEPTINFPSFSPATTRIYAWPYPQPKSFVALKSHEQKWKADMDADERSRDVDDGLEEWEDFAGPFVANEENGMVFSMIGSVFIKRAKRAFWAGKGWARFEQEEISAQTDEVELPNDLRLALFDRLKQRLCEEIWSHAFPAAPVPDSAVPSPRVGATLLATSKPDLVAGPSTLPTLSNPSTTASRPKRPRITPPTAVQRAAGIIGLYHSPTYPDDSPQPLYENETAPPRREPLQTSLMDQIRGALGRGETIRREIEEDMRHASMSGVTVSGRATGTPSFEMGMRQAQETMESSDEGDE